MAKYCWNELCPASPVYYKLTGCIPPAPKPNAKANDIVSSESGVARSSSSASSGRAVVEYDGSVSTVTTDTGQMDLSVPRDRNGTFEPKLVAKGQTRLPGFDDKVISMYARGMTVREIKGHLEELYGIGVSPDLISRV